MKNGKLELTDFGQIVELENGTGLVTARDRREFERGETSARVEDLMIVRRARGDGLILVLLCAFNRVNYSLQPKEELRNGRPILRYKGKTYEQYDIEEGYSSLDSALREKGL
ncbi:MAG: hypothetical protein AABX11_07850 [Nanoarchaeota archaeon]